MEDLNNIESYINKILSMDENKTGRSYYGIKVEGKGYVRSVVTSVSANCDVLEYAIEKKADLLLVNSIIMYDEDTGSLTGDYYQCMKILMEYEICLLAYPKYILEKEKLSIINKYMPNSNNEGIQKLGLHLQHQFGIKHYHFQQHHIQQLCEA